MLVETGITRELLQKTVTTISGVKLNAADLARLAAELKRHCGTGGSAKHGVIIIQGDHREKLLSFLDFYEVSLPENDRIRFTIHPAGNTETPVGIEP